MGQALKETRQLYCLVSVQPFVQEEFYIYAAVTFAEFVLFTELHVLCESLLYEF
jgi:hypothetical protein